MSLLTLTAVNLSQGGADPTNLTAQLVSLGSNTGVKFTNTGREILIVSVGATPTTPTSDIGTTVQGQTVPGVSGGALTATAISILGPYPSQYDKQDGTSQVEVDFSSQTSVSVALVHIPGVV
jgi:hypothetical protein